MHFPFVKPFFLSHCHLLQLQNIFYLSWAQRRILNFSSGQTVFKRIKNMLIKCLLEKWWITNIGIVRYIAIAIMCDVKNRIYHPSHETSTTQNVDVDIFVTEFLFLMCALRFFQFIRRKNYTKSTQHIKILSVYLVCIFFFSRSLALSSSSSSSPKSQSERA